MKIEDFFKSLLPDFKKERIIEDARITRDEMRSATIPAYKNAEHLLKSWKFKDTEVLDRIQTFQRLSNLKHGNMISSIAAGLDLAFRNLEQVEELVDRLFNENVAADGMTYLKSQLLQFVEAAHFVSKYSRKFLIWVYIRETNSADEEASMEGALAPAEVQWLNANFTNFVYALNAVSVGNTDLRKHIEQIPDIVITPENLATTPTTVGFGKLDPFNMRFIPVKLNPIYHIRMRVAEWQANRYKAAVEELRACQLYKLNLEKVSQGHPDAAVQRQISYTDKRIMDLNFKIAEMEKAYA